MEIASSAPPAGPLSNDGTPPCFVCGEGVEPITRLAVTGHPARGLRDVAILLHPRCATHLAQRVLSSLHAVQSCADRFGPVPQVDYLGLTPTELRILRGLVTGETNRQIARRVGLTEKTVKNRVSIILSKLCASSRTEAAILAVKMGLAGGESRAAD